MPSSWQNPVEAQRAPVVPRARRLPDGEVLPLEQIVLQFVRHDERGVIQLGGGPGSGKTTALKHLAAVLPREARVVLVDDWLANPVHAMSDDHLVVAAQALHCSVRPIARLAMAPWGDDDRIEYLLAMHAHRCAAVMSRLRADREEATRLAGSPMLWRVVLDAFANDESLRFPASAVRRHALCELQRHGCLQAALMWCLRRICDGSTIFELPHPVMPLLMQRCVQVLLAAEQLAELLSAGKLDGELAGLPRELIRETALLLRARPDAQKRLERMMYLSRQSVAGPVSLLVATDPAWTPRLMQIDLSDGLLERAQWAGIDLSNANLSRADFTATDLSGASLHGARARQTNFAGANLRRADLRYITAQAANFSGSDLASAMLVNADLTGAELQQADLRTAACAGADFTGARFVGACLAGADLHNTSLVGATLDGADLAGAKLDSAQLDHVRLGESRLNGACFHQARLIRCDMEDLLADHVDFSSADLSGSLLSSSVLRDANFQQANLSGTGLANIDWEGADLRRADLSGATFHLGSSRSGLVGSTIPCEGSKTGFYSDDLDAHDYKPPEEIRRANLSGADLRGARIKGVDFYLVDLRGARYTKRQGRYLRKCGAIL